MAWQRSEIRKILGRSQRHEFVQGEFLFRQGDKGERVYLIQRGSVDILSEASHHTTRLARRGKGEVIGEMALLDSGIRGATARAATFVVARSLDKTNFDELLAHNPQLTLKVTQVLTQRMRSLQVDLAPLDSTEPRLGHDFGPFLLLAELGQGGAGVVYQALDKVADQLLAVKFIKGADDETRRRFEGECAVLEQVKHPNIVQICGYGRVDNYLYLAMELLQGQTLEERLRAGPLGWGEVDEWFLPVLEALVRAHESKFAHRDIKPSNIYRTRSGVIKLLDFGLARHEDSAHITNQGRFLGTAHYLAPERIGGQHDRAGTEREGDQYSLGATLYEALTGHTLFQDDDQLVVLMHHVNTPPRPPSAWRSDFPSELESIILRLLQKQPAQRYPDMREVLRVLRERKRGSVAPRPRVETPTTRFSPEAEEPGPLQ